MGEADFCVAGDDVVVHGGIGWRGEGFFFYDAEVDVFLLCEGGAGGAEYCVEGFAAFAAIAGSGEGGDGGDAAAKLEEGIVGGMDEDGGSAWDIVDQQVLLEVVVGSWGECVAAFRDAGVAWCVLLPGEFDGVAKEAVVDVEVAIGAIGIICSEE